MHQAPFRAKPSTFREQGKAATPAPARRLLERGADAPDAVTAQKSRCRQWGRSAAASSGGHLGCTSRRDAVSGELGLAHLAPHPLLSRSAMVTESGRVCLRGVPPARSSSVFAGPRRPPPANSPSSQGHITTIGSRCNLSFPEPPCRSPEENLAAAAFPWLWHRENTDASPASRRTQTRAQTWFSQRARPVLHGLCTSARSNSVGLPVRGGKKGAWPVRITSPRQGVQPAILRPDPVVIARPRPVRTLHDHASPRRLRVGPSEYGDFAPGTHGAGATCCGLRRACRRHAPGGLLYSPALAFYPPGCPIWATHCARATSATAAERPSPPRYADGTREEFRSTSRSLRLCKGQSRAPDALLQNRPALVDGYDWRRSTSTARDSCWVVHSSRLVTTTGTAVVRSPHPRRFFHRV